MHFYMIMNFIQANTLDGLLNDLELACQDPSATAAPAATTEEPNKLSKQGGLRAHSSSKLKSPLSPHLEGRITSDRNLSGQFPLEDDFALTKGVNALSKAKTSPPPVPQRDLSSVMAATAIKDNSRVANNLNELDVLLQDLSNAR